MSKIDPDCPLPDSDAWKKELLEWIDMNWSAKFGSTISYVNRCDLKQKIQEM